MTPHAKFCVDLIKGASRQIGEIYAKNFYGHMPFSETHLQVKPFGGFLRVMAQTMRYQARVCLFEVKN